MCNPKQFLFERKQVKMVKNFLKASKNNKKAVSRGVYTTLYTLDRQYRVNNETVEKIIFSIHWLELKSPQSWSPFGVRCCLTWRGIRPSHRKPLRPWPSFFNRQTETYKIPNKAFNEYGCWYILNQSGSWIFVF